MNPFPPVENRRILVVDDNPSIHEDFRTVLGDPVGSANTAARLSGAEMAIFGQSATAVPGLHFKVTCAHQGQEARELVVEATRQHRAFAVAFVDMRMPPGWGGIETIAKLWEVDPRLQIVICTAYSDDSWNRIVRQLGRTDRLLILKKPFDGDEARQLALTLSTKWNLSREAEARFADMEGQIHERTTELRLRSEELERQIARRMQIEQDLRTASEAALAASRAKTEFLSRMSHEFRTPLNGVCGMIDLLKRGSPTPQQLQYLNIAKESAAALLVLIDDLLDFSKLDAGRTTLEQAPFDLMALLEQSLAAFREPATAKGLELRAQFSPDLPASIIGDRRGIAQVLNNLLSNAVKFTATGQVILQASSVAGSMPSLRLAVQDSGAGVDPKSADGMFQPFSQLDGSSTRKHGGLGLGLAICGQLVPLMGGKIGVERPAGGGSIFWFTLPLKTDLNAASNPSATTKLEGLSALSRCLMGDSIAPSPASAGDSGGDQPAFDLEELMKRSLNDASFAAQSLRAFEHTAEKDLTAIRQFLEQGAAEGAAHAAHGLKGVAAHLGAKRLQSIAQKFETLGADGAGLEACLREMASEIQRCVRFVKDNADRLEGSAGTERH